MDAGLTATLSREFASNHNTTSDKLLTYKTLESCYFIIVIFIIILLLSVSKFLAFNWLNLNNLPPEEVSFALKIISVEIALRLLGHFYSGGFIGLEQQVKANIYRILYGIVHNGLVLVPILFLPSLRLFFMWQAITTLLYVISIRFDLISTLTGSIKLFFRKPYMEKKIILKVWKFAGGMMLISMVAGLNSQMDKLALSMLLPIDVLGLYSLAFALSRGISFISSPISTAILPRMTALFTAGKKEEASRMFSNVYLFVSIVVFSFAASMMFFAKELIWIWTNNHELAEKAYIYVPWIVAGTSFLSLGSLPFNVAIANGYTKYNNILGLSSLVISLPGYWILTYIFGGLGAAITYSFVQIIIVVILLYLVNKKFMQLNAKAIYIRNFILPIIFSVGTTFVFYNLLSFEANRLIIIFKIGIVIVCSLIVNILILVPYKLLFLEFDKIKKQNKS